MTQSLPVPPDVKLLRLGCRNGACGLRGVSIWLVFTVLLVHKMQCSVKSVYQNVNNCVRSKKGKNTFIKSDNAQTNSLQSCFPTVHSSPLNAMQPKLGVILRPLPITLRMSTDLVLTEINTSASEEKCNHAEICYTTAQGSASCSHLVPY